MLTRLFTHGERPGPIIDRTPGLPGSDKKLSFTQGTIDTLKKCEKEIDEKCSKAVTGWGMLNFANFKEQHIK